MSHQADFGRRSEHSGTDQRRPSPAGGAAQAPARPSGCVLNLGSRQIRVRPALFWTLAGVISIMAAWSAATAAYFAFSNDLLAGLMARQAQMQYAYENRISDLKGQVDRVTSRQLLDQEQFEYKLDQIVRRQAALESRAAALIGSPDAAAAKGPKPPVTAEPAESPATTPKPSPINDTPKLVPLPDRGAGLQVREPWPGANQSAVRKNATTIDSVLRDLRASLDRVEATQTAALDGLADTYDFRARRLRGMLADLGMDLTKVPPPMAMATGGPFVPVMPQPDASTFDRQLHRISIARAQLDRLHQALVTVPIRKPIPGELETTSGFGVRLDPFIRAPAMHTGVDLRGNFGDAVRATAAGTVTQAGWSGGYGRMVEIDHGNGFSTRYGHLSSIDVEEGQTVKIGQVVGRIGMTGRTTGPHLHYETRVDGEPVDPQRFLRAAARIGTTF
jgi:murein DD-endopeptidase MepM/ murein hydrolase activator NlpD